LVGQSKQKPSWKPTNQPTNQPTKQLERAAENARDVAGLIIESAPTYATPSSYTDALRAAAAACALVDAVVAAAAAGAPAAGFGLVRPPGHHAVPRAAMGFCLLNNAAVATRHAQRAHGLNRVAILDIDVHHGNGTASLAASLVGQSKQKTF
jgi:acetoin utilization deacetylase AcuC-like enzyme